MDKQRIFLIGALFLVVYFLIRAWDNDYGQKPTPQTTGLNSEQTTSLNTITQKDVPVSTVDKQETQTSKENKVIKAPQKQITIKTDTLNLIVNLEGGDIIELNLPKYPVSKKEPNKPFTLLHSENGTYIAQSGLVGLNGPDSDPKGRPFYQAQTNLYEMKEDENKLQVDLTLKTKEADIIKRFEFTRGDYHFKTSYIVTNKQPIVWQAALFGQIKRDGEKDPSSTNATSIATYVGAAFRTNEALYKKVSFDKIKDEGFKENLTGGWVAMLQHYFLSAWVPSQEEKNNFYTQYQEGPFYIVGFTGPLVNIDPQKTQTLSATFYAGPKIQSILKTLSEGLNLTVDYGMLWWLAQPLFWLMTQIHKLLGNWGWTIVVLTLIVKLALFNLSAAGYRSMANMRRVAPQLQRVKELYGDDRQKMSQAMMELYRKEKINPLGGCLPILIQIPVFLALYWTLLESVELRQAPFILWIQDLSIKDPYFVLPILMGASMIIQQKLSPLPPDPVQARVMKMMPIIFTFFFLWFPSGLVLYWVVSNTLSILQQWVITRQIEAKFGKES